MKAWPPGSEDSIGQVGEFRVWAELITQSGGGLHVFLPTLDRGIDAVVHRLHDRVYLALQVKTKSVHTGPKEAVRTAANSGSSTLDRPGRSWPTSRANSRRARDRITNRSRRSCLARSVGPNAGVS